MKKLVKHTLVASAVMSCFAAQAGEIKGINAANVIPNRYIVVFKDTAMTNFRGEKQSTAVVANAVGQRFGAKVERAFNHVLNGAVITTDVQNAKRLADDPEVAYVEADQIMRISGTQTSATWGLDRIDQTNLPLNGSFTYPSSSGVHAYILDTGIRGTHNDFTGRMGNGYTAVNDGQGTNDCQGHGTHVAGTVGGTTWGVAKNVTLHPVRVLGCDGSGSNSGVIAGMDWVTANAVKPAVANMSLGGGASQATDDAIARMTNAGIATVVAAGNDSSNACNYSPARAPSAITVGSTTSSDAMSSFSNYGSCVDVYGPGSNITSASYSSNTGSTSMSGTSMASPHLAGVAALYLAANPNATPSQVTTAIVNNSLTGKITGIPSGVNKFVNIQFLNGDVVTPPTGGVLTKDVAKSFSAATGQSAAYTFVVPTGATNLTFKMSGGTGDGDLYTKLGSAPTTTSYLAKSDGSTNAETITIAAPTAGTYHLLANAYAAVNGASIVASYQTGTTPPSGTVLVSGTAQSVTLATNASKLYYITVPTGKTSLTFTLSGGTGDADLYARMTTAPTTTSYTKKSDGSTNTETITFSAPAAGTYYLLVNAYAATNGASVKAVVQ
ncbi:S8 family peptidase [Undibacterium amnicola]|uniref:S8 family peptidase n=1 Tax=Undibacterium amnicola TaxID=1834038 RepID=A0ABR6XSB8_9BURK|nr:S8 family peptidase [Undibacterium amnicola]MBC3832370.1 S8 family peptidase [Undibacterium amnicola]